MTPHVAVIGGGWAGCAAALTLAEAGTRVTLFEASRTLGGRARAVKVAGQTLDNGQHILLGAYEQTLRLIHRLDPTAARENLWRLPLTIEQPPDFRLACPRLPAPLHLLAGLLSARGLSWHEKLAAAGWAHSLLNTPAPMDQLSVGQVTRRQTERLNRLLWHPLCISALNTPPDMASASVFRDVIRAAFGGRNHHSDLLLPRRDLTTLFPDQAVARLIELGGTLRVSSRVSVLEAMPNAIKLSTRDDMAQFSHVVIAVAPQHLAGLAAAVPELASSVRDVANYSYQPIATAYVQYDPEFKLGKPMLALANGPAQFVFDRGQSHGQSGLLALVASAAADLPTGWVNQAVDQLQRVVDPGSVRWHKSIVERQATYACIPNMSRPANRTQHARIFLAGDYTESPFPATLESATRSGVQSAGALLESL